MLLEQFVENFRQAAQALPAPAGAASTAPTGATPEPAVASEPPRAAPQVAKEINGLAIVWMLIKNWFAGLFGKKS
jgi:uncharacterized protein